MLLCSAGPLLGQTFVFDLAGSQEVPPQPSPTTGGCIGLLDQMGGEFMLTCSHNVSGATLMHIHRAPAGANGPVVFDLGSPASPVQATWTGMTAGDIADLLGAGLYINVHSAGRPDGEVRGQILTRTVDNFSFPLEGSQQVPPDVSAATGNCTADLSDDATMLAVDCTHNVTMPTDAHLHNAPVGVNGPIVFDFPGATSPISGIAPLTLFQVADFAAGFLYVNIHSLDSPDGELRGQIRPAPAAPTTGTIRITKATLPAGGTGFGFTDNIPGSAGSFTLDDGQTQTFASITPGTYMVSEDDPAVTLGGFFLFDLSCDDGNSSGNVFGRTATINLEAGETLTCVFTNAEDLGAGEIFVFDLSAKQEVPPGPSTATGGCLGQLDPAAAEFTLTCSHKVAAATLMHIHGAPAGFNGPVVFDLGNPASPVQATWTGMTPGDIADLRAGNLYVNVHTGARPDGEIRGQILERTIDRLTFFLLGSRQVPPDFSTAIGTCIFDLNDDATGLFVKCDHEVTQPTAAHLHNGAAGANGPVVFDFGDPTSPFSATVALTPRTVAEFVAGCLYVNVHSVDSPDGEVRGQLGPDPFLPESIPTLSEWALLLLTLTLLGGGLYRLKIRDWIRDNIALS